MTNWAKILRAGKLYGKKRKAKRVKPPPVEKVAAESPKPPRSNYNAMVEFDRAMNRDRS